MLFFLLFFCFFSFAFSKGNVGNNLRSFKKKTGLTNKLYCVSSDQQVKDRRLERAKVLLKDTRLERGGWSAREETVPHLVPV